MRRLVVFLCVVFLVGGVSRGYASPTAAVSFSGVPNIGYTGELNWGLGFTFIPKSNITVTHLGVYDHDPNGFSFYDHDADEDYKDNPTARVNWRNVAIYDYNEDLEEGSRIAIARVCSDDELDGFFRYAPVSDPVYLVAQEKYLVAGITGWEPYTYDPAGFLAAGEIDFGTAHFVNTDPGQGLILTSEASFDTPSNEERFNPGAFGGTFKFEVTNVPVPSAVILLASGLLSLGAIRRQRSKHG